MYLVERSKKNITQLICQLVCANVLFDVMDLQVRINSCYDNRIFQTPSTFSPLLAKMNGKFACIALGTALPLTFYKAVHSSAQTEVNVVDFFSENNDIPSFFYVRYCN